MTDGITMEQCDALCAFGLHERVKDIGGLCGEVCWPIILQLVI